MRGAAIGLTLDWLVLLGSWADAQTGMIPLPPGHVKVTVGVLVIRVTKAKGQSSW
jgi:hypothetical protein